VAFSIFACKTYAADYKSHPAGVDFLFRVDPQVQTIKAGPPTESGELVEVRLPNLLHHRHLLQSSKPWSGWVMAKTPAVKCAQAGHGKTRQARTLDARIFIPGKTWGDYGEKKQANKWSPCVPCALKELMRDRRSLI
jgi:hypothetical protein